MDEAIRVGQYVIGAMLVLSLLACVETGMDGDVELYDSDGNRVEQGAVGEHIEYPLFIRIDMGTTYGGDPSETVGGDVFVGPDQNCELHEPATCTEDGCKAVVKVTGEGLCAYGIKLESDPGGGVSSCHHRIFTRDPEQAEKIRGHWPKGLDSKASERCWPE